MLKKVAENSILHEELHSFKGKLDVAEREIAQLQGQLSKSFARNSRVHDTRQSIIPESRQSLFHDSRQSLLHVSNEGSIGRVPQLQGSLVRASIFAINVEELQEADRLKELLFEVDQGKKKLNDDRIALRRYPYPG